MAKSYGMDEKSGTEGSAPSSRCIRPLPPYRSDSRDSAIYAQHTHSTVRHKHKISQIENSTDAPRPPRGQRHKRFISDLDGSWKTLARPSIAEKRRIKKKK